ncbi:MAG: hypothetical protein H7A36_03045 [Chlamydiales bacterium]|nr:hypothetical protein [Chlamydiales bacterium]
MGQQAANTNMQLVTQQVDDTARHVLRPPSAPPQRPVVSGRRHLFPMRPLAERRVTVGSGKSAHANQTVVDQWLQEQHTYGTLNLPPERRTTVSSDTYAKMERPGGTYHVLTSPSFRGASGGYELGAPEEEGQYELRPPEEEGQYELRPPEEEGQYELRPPEEEGQYELRPPEEEGQYELEAPEAAQEYMSTVTRPAGREGRTFTAVSPRAGELARQRRFTLLSQASAGSLRASITSTSSGYKTQSPSEEIYETIQPTKTDVSTAINKATRTLKQFSKGKVEKADRANHLAVALLDLIEDPATYLESLEGNKALVREIIHFVRDDNKYDQADLGKCLTSDAWKKFQAHFQ